MTDAAAREQTGTETAAEGHGLRVPFSAAPAPPGPAPRAVLRRAVVVKLALDLLFVCGLAFYSYADTFRAAPEGSLERADGRGASGWVRVGSRGQAPVEVQLFVDGRFVAAGFADRPLPDAQSGDARRGFAFELDPPLEGGGEARVFAVRAGREGARRTLRQVGAARPLAAR